MVCIVKNCNRNDTLSLMLPHKWKGRFSQLSWNWTLKLNLTVVTSVIPWLLLVSSGVNLPSQPTTPYFYKCTSWLAIHIYLQKYITNLGNFSFLDWSTRGTICNIIRTIIFVTSWRLNLGSSLCQEDVLSLTSYHLFISGRISHSTHQWVILFAYQ